MSIAALPMYDFPELQHATDALWTAIATRLEDQGVPNVPTALTRGPDLHAIWTDPNLLLAQTCGYPLVTSLKDKVAVLTTPCYNAPGCDGPLYRSAIIVRATDPATGLSDLRGRRCAINDPASNSGMNVLRAAIAPLTRGTLGFFSKVLVTGSHAASAEAVADGRADIAALDCVTWSHLQNLRPVQTRQLRVLCWSHATPGLPLITAFGTDAATIHALTRALDDATMDHTRASIRRTLHLDGFVTLPLDAYDVISTMARETSATGLAALRLRRPLRLAECSSDEA